MTRCLILMLTIAAWTGFAEEQKPAAALQGTWKGITYQEADSDKVLSGEDFDGSFLVIKGDKFTLKARGKVVLEGTVKLATDKNPKEIDLAGKDLKLIGIYVIDGDNLKLCYDGEGKVRPKEFKCKSGTGHRLITMKRE